MRSYPDFPPPSAQPRPPRNSSPGRPDPESPTPRQAGSQAPEKDRLDYDDGAWM
jgi:hypothetical protein